MSDRDFRKEDRHSIETGAEALHRAYEEVNALAIGEENESRRERLIGFLNTVGEKFIELGDQVEKDFKADEDAKAEKSRREADEKSAKAGR